MRLLRITEGKIRNWLKEESGVLNNKDCYITCWKTGNDHSVELGQTVVSCILGDRPYESSGHSVRKNGRAIQTMEGYGLLVPIIIRPFYKQRWKSCLISCFFVINCSNTKWFRTAIITAMALMGWLGSAGWSSYRHSHVISGQIMSGTGDTWCVD